MNLEVLNVSLEQLRSLIGEQVALEGAKYEVIEVLEDGPALILQDCTHHTTIQADQHGEPHRRVPSTRSVPILVADGSEFNPTFLSLDIMTRL